MRALFLALGLLVAASASSATVRLRHAANGNIIEAEVVEVAADKLSFRLAGGERVYVVEWETLDLAWIKENSPALWNERELLLRPAEQPKPKEDPAADPFAKETPPADARAILRNLASALADRTKGIEAGRVESFCREARLEEEVFWKAYDELRRDSLPAAAAPDKSDKSSKSSRSRDNKPGNEWERSAVFRAKEDALRAQAERGQGGLTCAIYLRALAEGGYKGRVAWQLLRFLPDEKRALVERLQKYEVQAGELAERAPTPDGKRDALVLRKLLADLVASLGRVTRESSVQEERLKNEAAALAGRLGK